MVIEWVIKKKPNSIFNPGIILVFYVIPHSVSWKETLPGAARLQAHLSPKKKPPSPANLAAELLSPLISFTLREMPPYRCRKTPLSEIYFREECFLLPLVHDFWNTSAASLSKPV